MSEQRWQIRVLDSLKNVDKTLWDSFANPKDEAYNPFISYDFLWALEETKCAINETGWLAQHLALETETGKTLGFLPAYLKNHSQGEYVFDHAWADAFMRAGGNYYPKLQSCTPFTPATGRRLLAHEPAHKLALAHGYQQLCHNHKISSTHITFMEKAECEHLIKNNPNYLMRNDQQFHFFNEGYDNFDGFLETLASRKRKAIKKERKLALENNGVSIEWITGNELTEEIWDAFFTFYQDTGARKWGSPYLTREFFSKISERMSNKILLIMAKRNERYIAGALNFIGSDTLFGRHWGCIEDHAYLHFEICYYQAIDYAIEHKLKRVEAGAQGAHKLARGYVPTLTYSAHYIAHEDFRRAIKNYLHDEREAVKFDQNMLKEHAPFKKEIINANDL
jgi:predicted N-acyltransferase